MPASTNSSRASSPASRATRSSALLPGVELCCRSRLITAVQYRRASGLKAIMADARVGQRMRLGRILVGLDHQPALIPVLRQRLQDAARNRSSRRPARRTRRRAPRRGSSGPACCACASLSLRMSLQCTCTMRFAWRLSARSGSPPAKVRCPVSSSRPTALGRVHHAVDLVLGLDHRAHVVVVGHLQALLLQIARPPRPAARRTAATPFPPAAAASTAASCDRRARSATPRRTPSPSRPAP